jgi:hypothetical protein
MPPAQFSPASEPSAVARLQADEPSLSSGENVLADAPGVRLGWQLSTIVIWWVPSAVFGVLAWVEFRSVGVTVGLLVFCLLLFLFYSSDREVRPRSGSRRYVLTDKRLLIGTLGSGWRDVPLSDIAITRMEEGAADRAVAYLSRAATVVLELRAPGAKGEPRRLRIGPLREPRAFRSMIDERIEASRPAP